MRTDLPDQFALSGIDPATGGPASVLTVGLGTGSLTIAVSTSPISTPPTGNTDLLDMGSFAITDMAGGAMTDMAA